MRDIKLERSGNLEAVSARRNVTDATLPEDVEVAVLIPCYNEGITIGRVVADFREALSKATIYVYDNNSTDDTAERAAAAGAVVAREPLQGKGNVVRRMFADIEADIYILVDGDATYSAACAGGFAEVMVRERLDLVNGKRVTDSALAYRVGHRLGNRVLTGLVRWIFGSRLTDMLSGYKVLSRRFVKSFPALSSGFEIETEITVHALELRMPLLEVETPYGDRPGGSFSKLSTIRDGLRILRLVLHLVKEERPLMFFGVVCLVLAVTSLALAFPVVIDYIETGLVPRFPTAILATGMMLVAFLSLVCGMILDTVTHGRREMKRLHYLSIPITDSSGHERAEAPRSD